MTERFLVANGARLWAADEGEGPPVLLLNGGPGCGDYLAPVADMLAGIARTVRLETRGCGRSSPDGPFDLETALADLDAVRRALGFDRWTVLGHSWGADLALAHALAFPERTRAFVSICGTGAQNDRDWSAAYKLGRAQGRDESPNPAPTFDANVNRALTDSWRLFVKAPDVPRRLADLEVPALIIAGAEDVRPDWPLRQLAALLPNARFASVEGAGHVPWLRRGGELRARLRAFLAETVGGPA